MRFLIPQTSNFHLNLLPWNAHPSKHTIQCIYNFCIRNKNNPQINKYKYIRDGSNRRADKATEREEEKEKENKINEWVTARCSDLSSHTFTVSIAPDENKEIKIFILRWFLDSSFLRLIIIVKKIMLRKWILNSLIHIYFVLSIHSLSVVYRLRTC